MRRAQAEKAFTPQSWGHPRDGLLSGDLCSWVPVQQRPVSGCGPGAPHITALALTTGFGVQ